LHGPRAWNPEADACYKIVVIAGGLSCATHANFLKERTVEAKSKKRVANPWHVYSPAMQKCDAKFDRSDDGKLLYVSTKSNGGIKVKSVRTEDAWSVKPKYLQQGAKLLKANGQLALKCTDSAVQRAGETIMGYAKDAPSVTFTKELRKAVHTLSKSPAYVSLSDKTGGRGNYHKLHATMRNFQDDLRHIAPGAPLILTRRAAKSVEPEGSEFHVTKRRLFDSDESNTSSGIQLKRVVDENGTFAQTLEGQELQEAGWTLACLAAEKGLMTKTKELVRAVDVLADSITYRAYSSKNNWLEGIEPKIEAKIEAEKTNFAKGIPNVSLDPDEPLDPYEVRKLGPESIGSESI
jgi:hypothetical protein